MYYTAKVLLEFETDKGGIKKKTETFLVNDDSVTDAEAIVHTKFSDYKFGFEVKSVSQSNVIEVLYPTVQ